MTQKLISLLEQYLEENKRIKDQYKFKQTQKALYEELINSLKDYENIENNKMFIVILLDTIYSNDSYTKEFYSLLLNSNKPSLLHKFIHKIEAEYNELTEEIKKLKLRIDRNRYMFASAYRVIGSLKYQSKISDARNDVTNIKRIISYYEMSGIISNREELLLINEIEMHNRKVAAKYGDTQEQDYTDYLYNEMPNIISIGFQEHDEFKIDEERKQSLNKMKKELINTIDYIDTDMILEMIETYKQYNLTEKDYLYLITALLNEYFDELITLYELLVDKDTYTHRKNRVQIIKHYYSTLDKYLLIKNYYEDLLNIKESLILEEVPEEIDLEPKDQKVLIYSHSNVNINKSRLISDMSDMPEEYYETVYTLLDEFKNGTITRKEIKPLSNSNKVKGHIELRYDQVRIVLKHIQDNIYAVLGTFAKKADNDVVAYVTIAGRDIPKIDTQERLNFELELSAQVEKELDELVQTNGRKGHR